MLRFWLMRRLDFYMSYYSNPFSSLSAVWSSRGAQVSWREACCFLSSERLRHRVQGKHKHLLNGLMRCTCSWCYCTCFPYITVKQSVNSSPTRIQAMYTNMELNVTFPMTAIRCVLKVVCSLNGTDVTLQETVF